MSLQPKFGEAMDEAQRAGEQVLSLLCHDEPNRQEILTKQIDESRMKISQQLINHITD